MTPPLLPITKMRVLVVWLENPHPYLNNWGFYLSGSLVYQKSRIRLFRYTLLNIKNHVTLLNYQQVTLSFYRFLVPCIILQFWLYEEDPCVIFSICGCRCLPKNYLDVKFHLLYSKFLLLWTLFCYGSSMHQYFYNMFCLFLNHQYQLVDRNHSVSIWVINVFIMPLSNEKGQHIVP